MSPRVYAVRGLRLAYHEWGDPSGPPLLCFHGFLDHGQSFAAVAEALPNRRVIALDFRGHGHSEWVGAGGYYHFHDYFFDARALVDHLGLARYAILAHSMGGSVATGLAAIDARVEALVLLEGMGPPAGDASEYPDRLRRWVDALEGFGDAAARAASRKPMASLEDAARRLRTVNARLSPERALALAASFTERRADGLVWRYDPLHKTPSARPFYLAEAAPMWSAIRAPVLSLIGADTAFTLGDLDARHAALSSARVADVPGAGHNVHHDAPALVADAVRWWLEDRDGPPPAGLALR